MLQWNGAGEDPRRLLTLLRRSDHPRQVLLVLQRQSLLQVDEDLLRRRNPRSRVRVIFTLLQDGCVRLQEEPVLQWSAALQDRIRHGLLLRQLCLRLLGSDLLSRLSQLYHSSSNTSCTCRSRTVKSEQSIISQIANKTLD